MRGNLWLASALISCLFGSQQPSAGQPSSLEPRQDNVRKVLAAFGFCKYDTTFTSLGIEMAKLGDDVSADILKGLKRTDLARPENVKGYLCVVRLAFWRPGIIARDEDKIPGVTMFLLEYLKQRTSDDADLAGKINSVEAYVKEQTEQQPSSSQAPSRPPE